MSRVNQSDYYASDWMAFDWSPWISLNPHDAELSRISTNPGLYRVRHLNRDGLTYIGQTGRSLRGRLRALAGCYEEEMPYTDPHVAAPCLWAVRQEHGPEFEVSVIEPKRVEEKQTRLSIEEALIAVYRRESGENTTANFGRIIDGYKRSSRQSGGFTGGELSDEGTESNSETGIGPLPWTDANKPTSGSWMGIEWTEPEPLADAYGLPEDRGVYRIWDESEPLPLEYIGQSSNLKRRLYSHRRNRDGEFLFSYSILENGDAKHKREQIETDLIGAHWLATESAPQEQF